MSDWGNWGNQPGPGGGPPPPPGGPLPPQDTPYPSYASQPPPAGPQGPPPGLSGPPGGGGGGGGDKGPLIAIIVFVVLALGGGGLAFVLLSDNSDKGDEETGSSTTAGDDNSTTTETPPEESTTTLAETTEPGMVSVFTLVEGDCYTTPADSEEVSEVEVVDCAELHDQEVYAVFELPDEAEAAYPGKQPLTDRVTAECITLFNEFIGLDYNNSIYDFYWFQPTEESWGQGDREVTCSAYHPDGTQLEGSLEGVAE